MPGFETPKSGSNWTGNGNNGDGILTPASPSKERRPLVASQGIMSTAEVVSNAYDAAKGAHAIVVCTEWDEFKYDLNMFKFKFVNSLLLYNYCCNCPKARKCVVY